MSSEDLALQTQLLLQEAVQPSTTNVLVTNPVDESPVLTQYQTEKLSLLEKLKKKKELLRQNQKKIQEKRFQMDGSTIKKSFGPKKHLLKCLKLPVASQHVPMAKKKKDLLTKLREQAIHQGSEEMAKLFGYSSYEEQLKHLNKLEKIKILENQLKEKEESKLKSQQQQEIDKEEENEPEVELHNEEDVQNMLLTIDKEEVHEPIDQKLEHTECVVDAPEAPMTDEATDSLQVNISTDTKRNIPNSTVVSPVSSKRLQRKKMCKEHDNEEEEVDEPWKNQSPSLQQHSTTSTTIEDDGNEADSEECMADNDDDKEAVTKSKDRAANYRRLLQEEAEMNRRRKKALKKKGASEFVESEAEEDEEEDALKIGGLGDFGFGVPQAQTTEAKEKEEEKKALEMREDDLEGIVDELSDEEKQAQEDLDEIFRRDQEEQDRLQVKEVMRNVKEGFGRNRRAFSDGIYGGETARGRFNLNELVAADGKKEAARLGLLESDEELSDSEKKRSGTGKGTKKKKKKKKNTNDEDEDDDEEEEEEGDEEEEDEEAEMERMLRERYLNQPKIYLTSSESENEEEEDLGLKNQKEKEEEDIDSEEEREKNHMKLFSERARINRRMQRMQQLQREMIRIDEEEGHEYKKQIPNVLLEEEDDEDSQEFMKFLLKKQKKPTIRKVQQDTKKIMRNSISSSSSSSFRNIVDNCKMFQGNAITSKGFVFTSIASGSSSNTGNLEEELGMGQMEDEEEQKPSKLNQKSKSWSGTSKRNLLRQTISHSTLEKPFKRTKSSGFFNVLASYQPKKTNL